MSTPPLAALIFDVDGTIAETEEAHRQAFNLAFAEVGLPWRWDRALYRRLLHVAGGRERIRHFMDQEQTADGGDDLPARLHAIKTGHYTRLVGSGQVSLRPGIESLWREARAAGLALAIATTTTRANVTALLTGAGPPGCLDWFQVIACADDAPVKKPAPDVYLHVLERLGLDGAACLALEDSSNGVRAATAAGVPVVVGMSVFTAGDDFSGALAVLTDFGGAGLDELQALRDRYEFSFTGCRKMT
ncbi:MAG: HAD-IA family hydrolase [Alphaproteobacteria bacterium]